MIAPKFHKDSNAESKKEQKDISFISFIVFVAFFCLILFGTEVANVFGFSGVISTIAFGFRK